MEYCPQCKQTVPVKVTTPCKKCKGVGVVAAAGKNPGSLKQVGCSRCNGTGKEINNVSRRNRSRANATENQLAKQLQAWWRQYRPEAEFARTPASGGSKLKDGWDLRGDVTTNDPVFPFFVECKKEQAWQLHDLIKSPKGGRLGDYVRQVMEENVHKKISIIKFSHPGPSQPVFVMLFGHTPLAVTSWREALGGPDNDFMFSFDRVMPGPNGDPTRVCGLIMPIERFLESKPKAWVHHDNT